MLMKEFQFGITDWSQVTPIEHKGETGTATWRTCQCGDIQVRMVSYSPGYRADHWCSKGHILLCLEGEVQIEHQGGPTLVLRAGASYQVADNAEPHRASTTVGARVFIVD
jgi:quercetin dioxygenase-like cupin family protein